MDITIRLKMVIRYLISQNIADNQEKIGYLLGYTNKASFSHIINNRKPMPHDFLDRLVSLDKKLNKSWIETGEGNMLKDSDDPLYSNNFKFLGENSKNNVNSGSGPIYSTMDSGTINLNQTIEGFIELKEENINLKAEVKHLKQLLEEKERTIQILLKQQ